jgi:hypothetical protein
VHVFHQQLEEDEVDAGFRTVTRDSIAAADIYLETFQ